MGNNANIPFNCKCTFCKVMVAATAGSWMFHMLAGFLELLCTGTLNLMNPAPNGLINANAVGDFVVGDVLLATVTKGSPTWAWVTSSVNPRRKEWAQGTQLGRALKGRH